VPGRGAKLRAGSSALMRHSMAWPLEAGCRPGEGRASRRRRCGSARLTRSMPGDLFGHGMLHLDARVHLDEVEVARAIDEELDRAGARVAGRPRRPRRRPCPSLCAMLVGQARGGRLLDQLLVAALDGAVAFAEVDDLAVAVGRGSGTRCGAASRCTSRCRRADCRRPSRPRCGRRGTPWRSATSLCATRMPRPPPPATALMMTG
jgi:hypothetical protein